MTQKTTDELLEERGRTHGEYTEHARVTQGILDVCMVEAGWQSLPPIMRETVHMIAHKIGRVVTGNPHINDHWDDIAGYARLVSQRVNGEGLVGEHSTGARSAVLSDGDIYTEAASRWGVSREEAKTTIYRHLWGDGLQLSARERETVLSLRDAARAQRQMASDMAAQRGLVEREKVYLRGDSRVWVVDHHVTYGDGSRMIAVTTRLSGSGEEMRVVSADALTPAREARLVPRDAHLSPKSDAVGMSSAPATGRSPAPEVNSPGSPEDGGHHARQEDDA